MIYYIVLLHYAMFYYTIYIILMYFYIILCYTYIAWRSQQAITVVSKSISSATGKANPG